MNVLVDTSVWSLGLRRKPAHLSAGELPIVHELEELVREGRVRLLGMVRQELLSGIKITGQYEKLRNTLRHFPDEAVDWTDHEAAAEAFNQCRARGIAPSDIDALICAVAIRRDLLIFTTDPDFKIYSRVLPLQFHSPRDLAAKSI